MPPALCCSQLTSASPLHLLNKDQGTAGLRVSIPVQANVCMKHANGRSWGFSVLWAFPTPPNPPHAGGAALHSIAQSSAHPKTSLYPTEGKTEIKPEQPWHCQSRRAWGGWMPWSGHIPTPSTPSPCCGLCRRRPWLPGPAGRPCSRGSWGCSASPSPLLSPLPPAMHGRAAGTAQPQAQHSCRHGTARLPSSYLRMGGSDAAPCSAKPRCSLGPVGAGSPTAADATKYGRGELQGGGRHLPAAEQKPTGLQNPLCKHRLRLEEEMLQLPA